MSFLLSPPDLPLVTIGVPVYNGAEHLPATLNCLLAQDYPRLEILISDNASTDETGDIARLYAGAYPNIRYHRNSVNIGSALNFTSLTDKASGKYFMWAGTHDKWSPGLISAAVDVMEKNPTVALSYAVPYWITQEGKEIPIETTLIDTTTSTKLVGFVLTLWGLTACPQIYGVHRLEIIKRMMPYRKMFGPDTFILACIACCGSLALLPGEKFFMRQLGDFNDWSNYFRKMDVKLGPDSDRQLYWDFIGCYFQLVRQEFPKLSEQIPLLGMVLFCMLTKFSWVPGVVRQAYSKSVAAMPAERKRSEEKGGSETLRISRTAERS